MATSTARRTARTRTRQRAITPEDLLCLVGVGDAQMSPDGSHVLFVRKVVNDRNAYETSLWVADAAARRTPHALTKGPKDSHARWSPDGAQVAFIRAEANKAPALMVVAAKGGAPRVAAAMPHGTIRDLAWSPCGTRIAFSFRATAAEWTPEAADARRMSGASTPPRAIDDMWYRLDGDGYFGAQRFALYVVSVGGGTGKAGAGKARGAKSKADAAKPERVFDRDTLGTFTYDWAPDGSAIVIAANTDPRALWKPEETGLYVLTLGAPGKHRFGRLVGLPAGPKSHPRWSPDGLHIAYAGRVGKDSAYSTANLELFVHDLAARRARSLTAGTDACLMAATLTDTGDASFDPQLRWLPDGSAIFFRVGWHGGGLIASMGLDGGPIAFHSEPGEEASLGSFSADGWRLACIRSTPTQPGEVHVAEVQGALFPMRRVTGFNDALVAELRLAEPEERWVKAKDGHPVQCWVMRPQGARGRLPAILEVHGGPHAQYGLTFFHEFQLLCAQGYEVWFSNPRGSKGYGERHTAAIRGAWGTKDWVDVQAVLKAMRASKGVDRQRIGIMGGSYGGYMANWAVAHDHGFRAAITDRCVSNLISHAGNSDHPEVPDRYWKGAVWDRPEALWKASPIAHFKGVRTPMLIIHSEGDLRCNVEQGEQVYTALCTQGVPARFVRYPRESSHGLSRMGPPDLRIHRLREIVAWWAKWMA